MKASPEICFHRWSIRPENNYIIRWSGICLHRTTGVEQSAAGIKENNNTRYFQETFENSLIQAILRTMTFIYLYYVYISYSIVINC